MSGLRRTSGGHHLWYWGHDGTGVLEESWLSKYNEVKNFIEMNKRNPSKYRIEEHDMLNWVKANRKVMNAGKLKEDRVEAFEKLMALMEECKRVNQWK